MKKRLFTLILPALTLLLECLPYGAVCLFANPEGAAFRRTYSYFDLTPYGYANVAPFFTALITVLSLVILLLYLFTGKERLCFLAKIIFALSFFVSLCPLFFGLRYFTVVGALITLTLFAQWLFLWRRSKGAKKEEKQEESNL